MGGAGAAPAETRECGGRTGAEFPFLSSPLSFQRCPTQGTVRLQFTHFRAQQTGLATTSQGPPLTPSLPLSSSSCQLHRSLPPVTT